MYHIVRQRQSQENFEGYDEKKEYASTDKETTGCHICTAHKDTRSNSKEIHNKESTIAREENVSYIAIQLILRNKFVC